MTYRWSKAILVWVDTHVPHWLGIGR